MRVRLWAAGQAGSRAQQHVAARAAAAAEGGGSSGARASHCPPPADARQRSAAAAWHAQPASLLAQPAAGQQGCRPTRMRCRRRQCGRHGCRARGLRAVPVPCWLQRLTPPARAPAIATPTRCCREPRLHPEPPSRPCRSPPPCAQCAAPSPSKARSTASSWRRARAAGCPLTRSTSATSATRRSWARRARSPAAV